MSTEFRNDNDVNFGQLGVTTTLNGITLTQTIYNSVTGQTTATAFAPSSVNYVLSSPITKSITGNAFTLLIGSVLSINTDASRIVEISTISGGSNAYWGVESFTTSANNICNLKIIKGPSTQLAFFTLGGPVNINVSGSELTYPPSTIRAFDFTPGTGAATYFITGQVGNAGLSTVLDAVGLQVLVRQI